MKSLFRFFLLTLTVFFLTAPTGNASPVDSVDSSYDFHNIKNVMIYDIVLSDDTERTESEAASLQQNYHMQAEKLLEIPSINKERLNRKISLAIGKDLDVIEKTNPEEYAELVRQNMRAAVDIYVNAELASYTIGTYTIPAHTEWKTVTDYDTYKDKDGHTHTVTRQRTVPVYVPEQSGPYTHVKIRFTSYDAKTGKVIFTREELREENDSRNCLETYNKIVRSYFRDLRKKIK
ncbi:MAG: hypothetical protein E7198_11330 [Schwartzia succinivorans]|jgi:hypothetical protein|uniref:hypothetical protein n=1 Tax=Schwartzia succinivorans TaxID=55507 RepID=UPI0023557752|nr:hypothetical protein [Schwartzia succinivorans]MBE6098355.1 hypothetical protein [Schwartzia succinivorans]